MVRKNRFLQVVLFLMLPVLTAGCTLAAAPTSNPPASPAQPSITVPSATQTETPTQTTIAPAPTIVVPTATLSPVAGISDTPQALSPAELILREASSCNLTNSRDLALLFPPHNEIVDNPAKTGPVSHPPFSDASASGTETQCIFYDFHQPGVKTGWMLQVTTLVDAPDASQIQAWRQAWKDAKATSGQAVSGLGDDAFASAGNLFIKIGDTYIAYESIDTHLDNKSADGQKQLLAYNEQLAKTGLSQFQ